MAWVIPWQKTCARDLWPFQPRIERHILKTYFRIFPYDSHNLSLVDVSILLGENKCWSWGFHLPLLVLMSDVNKHFDKRCHGRTRLCKFLGRKHFCLKRNEQNYNFYWFCFLLLFLPFFFLNRSQVPVVIFSLCSLQILHSFNFWKIRDLKKSISTHFSPDWLFSFFSFCIIVESEAVGESLAAECGPSLAEPSSLSPSDKGLFLSPEAESPRADS